MSDVKKTFLKNFIFGAHSLLVAFNLCALPAQADPSLVSKIQRMLSQLCYDPGEVDGVYGDKTSKALEIFYRAGNIVFDGVPDSNEVTDLTTALSSVGIESCSSTEQAEQQAIGPTQPTASAFKPRKSRDLNVRSIIDESEKTSDKNILDAINNLQAGALGDQLRQELKVGKLNSICSFSNAQPGSLLYNEAEHKFEASSINTTAITINWRGMGKVVVSNDRQLYINNDPLGEMVTEVDFTETFLGEAVALAYDGGAGSDNGIQFNLPSYQGEKTLSLDTTVELSRNFSVEPNKSYITKYSITCFE